MLAIRLLACKFRLFSEIVKDSIIGSMQMFIYSLLGVVHKLCSSSDIPKSFEEISED